MWPGRLSTSIVSWVCEPADKLGAGARPARVTHCRFEHAGQNFGSLDRGPRAAHPMEWNGFDWRASEVGARRKTKQNPARVEPVEIPDAEHELVVERAAAINVAKATGKVCVRLPGKSGRRFSRVWDVPGWFTDVAAIATVAEGEHLRLFIRIQSPGLHRDGEYFARKAAVPGSACASRPYSSIRDTVMLR